MECISFSSESWFKMKTFREWSLEKKDKTSTGSETISKPTMLKLMELKLRYMSELSSGKTECWGKHNPLKVPIIRNQLDKKWRYWKESSQKLEKCWNEELSFTVYFLICIMSTYINFHFEYRKWVISLLRSSRPLQIKSKALFHSDNPSTSLRNTTVSWLKTLTCCWPRAYIYVYSGHLGKRTYNES